jgi:hypothetical protein
MTTTINAASNPALANKMAQEAFTPSVEITEEAGGPIQVTIPSLPETTVSLPGGYIDIDGSVITAAEVRELTGADEEVIVKILEPGKALMSILQRATVSIGGKPATKEMLSSLLAGDRELLLVAIRKATFGKEITVISTCPKCTNEQTFEINLDEVKVKELDDKLADRSFSIKIKNGSARVLLPTGEVQEKIINSTNKNTAELDTLLLSSCVIEINDIPVMNQTQIRNLGMQDRRNILLEIANRNPGPLLNEIVKTCPDCGSEVDLPLTLAELFRS